MTTTKERPPAPGLTRIDTGYPHGVYPGWYIRPGELRNIARRMKHAEPLDVDLDDPPPLPEATAVCGACGKGFRPTMNRADLCPRCRALRQHARARARNQSARGG